MLLRWLWPKISHNPVLSVRKGVYEKELEIIDCFPEVDFDFNIIPSLGRNATEIASGARVL
jgi:hypothetical protein